MTHQHILITGGTGLLALNWACALRGQCRVTLGTHQHTVSLAGVGSLPLSLDDPDEFARQLRGLRVDLVVHAAGLTNVDRCEQDPADAMQANAGIARTVARCAAEQGIALVHISTDHLFSGRQPRVGEDAQPEPMNAYARSKLQAEQWVAAACPGALILRTNFFGWGYAGRQSFSDWVLNGLRKGRSLSMFTDVHFTPILADVLALSAHRLVRQGAHGVFNLVGSERISKYDFGVRLARAFGLPQDLVVPSQIGLSQLQAPRPRDMSLDNSRMVAALGGPPSSLDGWFSQLQEQERQGRRDELFGAVGA